MFVCLSLCGCNPLQLHAYSCNSSQHKRNTAATQKQNAGFSLLSLLMRLLGDRNQNNRGGGKFHWHAQMRSHLHKYVGGGEEGGCGGKIQELLTRMLLFMQQKGLTHPWRGSQTGCLLHMSLSILRTITQDLSPFTRAWEGQGWGGVPEGWGGGGEDVKCRTEWNLCQKKKTPEQGQRK